MVDKSKYVYKSVMYVNLGSKDLGLPTRINACVQVVITYTRLVVV